MNKLINMKKVFLTLACTSLCFSAVNAQIDLVKKVDKGVGASNPNYQVLRESLKPALSDESSKNSSYTWFTAAKVELSEFDDLYKKSVINPASVDSKKMGLALLNGINYLKTALPFDSVPELDKKTGQPKIDKKTGQPKIKAEYTEKIYKLLAENYISLNNVASTLHQANDYENAAKCYELCATLPFESYMKNRIQQPADTVVGEIRFWQGVALWQATNPAEALKAFKKAIDLGYTSRKEAFDYPLSCAAELKNDAEIIEIAKAAIPFYGKQDNQYVSIIINHYLFEEKFDLANQFLDQAISDNPQNAEFCNLKGNLVEKQTSIEEALPYFQKAVELDPNNSKAQFDLGRYYYNKAVKVRDEKVDLTGAQLAKLVNPLYEQALPYLEKAYELDKDNYDAKNALRSIYYQLGNEDKLNAIESQN